MKSTVLPAHRTVISAERDTQAAQETEAAIRRRRLWESIRPYLYIGPALVFLTLFFYYPMLSVFTLSFFDWTLLDLSNRSWYGLANYSELFQDPDFAHVLANTAIYTVATVGLGLLLALLLALWLNRSSRRFGLLQGMLFSPHIISLVSISILWLWIMDPQYGLLNTILDAIGVSGLKWLADPSTALPSLILVALWKGVGYNMIVLIAGLQSIPREIHEAAMLDNVSRWRVTWRITIPLLSPSLFFLLIMNTISSFQVFDTISIMTQGGPVNSTNMLVYYIYEQGMDFFNGGYAAAGSVVLLAAVGLVTLAHFALLSRRVHYH
ncbi:carbohydrate ABC transporter permease [Paenibacillus apiarius]|uniref:carbohydrate ABC transporter permease n=1 Tax=Paenibacillus apiarius TaxID=46240 RepID=UPI00197E4ADB|nr:sugar ABC transporter permease [Paenibacillus apiarius]MBN3524021.1 sugar ABC transporter permease [Paenibacillus apiarius]